MPKLDARDVLAVLALLLFGGAMWLDHVGWLADWAKQPVSTIPTVVLGYYFVDSFRKAQASVAQSPPGEKPGA